MVFFLGLGTNVWFRRTKPFSGLQGEWGAMVLCDTPDMAAEAGGCLGGWFAHGRFTPEALAEQAAADWDGLHMQCSTISGAVRRMASRNVQPIPVSSSGGQHSLSLPPPFSTSSSKRGPLLSRSRCRSVHVCSLYRLYRQRQRHESTCWVDFSCGRVRSVCWWDSALRPRGGAGSTSGGWGAGDEGWRCDLLLAARGHGGARRAERVRE
jgi:hypothetical protein